VREARKSSPHRIGDLVATLMRKAVRPGRRDFGEVSMAWVRAVGPEVARRSRPVGFREGRLTVSFDSSALRQEVASFRAEELLTRLREECPETRIASLKCVLG